MALEWKVEPNKFVFKFNTGMTDTDKSQLYKLEELEAINFAEKVSDTEFIVDNDKLVQLTPLERELLDIPRIFPYRIKLSTCGAVARQDLRYIVEFLRPNGEVFVNPQVVGAYIKISEELEYTFNIGQYYVVKNALECNKTLELASDDFDVMNHNFLHLAGIKEAAENIGAEIDEFITRNKIIVPKKLSILPRFEKNGDLYIDPVLMTDNGEYIPNCEEFSNRFNVSSKVKTVYRGGNGYYVIPSNVAEGLNEIKKISRIKRDDYEKLTMHPETFFTSKSFIFNAVEYSDRVIDYGQYKYRNENYGSSGISWLPEEGTAFVMKAEEKSFVNEDNYKDIESKVQEARAVGKDTINVDGNEIPIDIGLLNKLNLFNKNDSKIFKDTSLDNVNEVKDKTKNKKADKNILIISDNIESMDYVRGSKSSKLDEADVMRCLNDDVKLLRHQQEGVAWLLQCYAEGKGALLADDMGLGKTLQTLTFLAVCKKYSKKEDFDSVLIVAPVSLLDNWRAEYKKFIKDDIFKGIKIINGNSLGSFKTDRGYDISKIAKNHIVLMSYETLRLNHIWLGKIDWSIMVLDEAQKIKTPTAQITLAIKAMKYDFGLCLTGTPIENTWIDLWSIMDFANPGNKFGSLSEFKEKYIKILKDNNKDETTIKSLGEQLHNTMGGMFKRRLKSKLCAEGALPELPEKIINKRTEIMPAIQKTAYESVINNVDDGVVNKSVALEVIAKLRDVSLYPNISAIDERMINSIDAGKIFNTSARLKVLFQELVKTKAMDEKILVFAESKKMQRILRTVIEKHFDVKVPVAINGDMDGLKRQTVVDEFNKKEGFGVLILSPLAAGVGLNIASANHVVHLSRHWNPAKEDQATDRAYRIGQKKPVDVCIPMAIHPAFGEKGSFDEKLDMLLEYKRKLSEHVLLPIPDSDEDGVNIFRDIFKSTYKKDESNKDMFVDIEYVDFVNGITFEKIIAELYKVMGYTTEKTPDSNDNGADVIALSTEKGKRDLLIQCKKTSDYSKTAKKVGVQEIAGAKEIYDTKLKKNFKCVVITNAMDFTSSAKEYAGYHKVQLIARTQLEKLLKDYQVNKWNI